MVLILRLYLLFILPKLAVNVNLNGNVVNTLQSGARAYEREGSASGTRVIPSNDLVALAEHFR